MAANIDIVEPVGRFTAQLRGQPGVRHIFNVGLEEWAPAAALAPGTGVIVVKEKLSTSGEDVFDPVDSCVTRLVPFLFLFSSFFPTSLAVEGKKWRLLRRREG